MVNCSTELSPNTNTVSNYTRALTPQSTIKNLLVIIVAEPNHET